MPGARPVSPPGPPAPAYGASARPDRDAGVLRHPGAEIGYAFDNTAAAVAEQYRSLAAFLDPITCARLADAGVGPGDRCLDVGTGGGSVARWLAVRVAPGGSVLATDTVPPNVPDPEGLRFVRHDITRDPLPDGAFDVIVARLVLRHLPSRQQVLGRLLAALRPGGLLQVDEFDDAYSPVLLAPDRRARSLYESFLAAKARMFTAAGVDGRFGQHAAEAMRAAGFRDIDPVPSVQPWSAGSPGVELLAHTARQLAPRFEAVGMTRDQLEEVCALLRDPGFRASSCVVYSVQGRRPA